MKIDYITNHPRLFGFNLGSLLLLTCGVGLSIFAVVQLTGLQIDDPTQNGSVTQTGVSDTEWGHVEVIGGIIGGINGDIWPQLTGQTHRPTVTVLPVVESKSTTSTARPLPIINIIKSTTPTSKTERTVATSEAVTYNASTVQQTERPCNRTNHSRVV